MNTKKALMSLWKDRFSLIEYHEDMKSNDADGFKEVAILENQPCKLSFSTLKEANQDDTGAAVIQIVKLFCDNQIDVKPGSKIVIQRDGRTYEYSQSGQPGIFSQHQEIVLIPFQGWA